MTRNFFLFFLLILSVLACRKENTEHPRVFIFTDINIDAGDPDDRQSLVHLLWYANELDIEGIVPDRWGAQGLEACQMAVDAYAKDFNTYKFGKKGYPLPDSVKHLLATDLNGAKRLFHEAAASNDRPLYVLIWGNMRNFGEALRERPDLAKNIRLITIGTGLMMEEHIQYLPEDWEKTDQPCTQYNWNGHGRNEIYNDPRFKDMWWLEINWTYEGMFSGDEPKKMWDTLSTYGEMGAHFKEVTKNQPWARYFRVGDTPSVLYVIDPDNDLDDPTHGSWAGIFKKPFPEERPNYYTDHNDSFEWDYANPCNTWENHVAVNKYAKSTLEKRRERMYAALLGKLHILYK